MDIFRKHEEFEIEVLDKMNSAKLLEPLVFGGGSMLRLCHELNRYSVDLDFWFVKKISPQEYYDKIRNTIVKDYEITDSQMKHYTLLVELRSATGALKMVLTRDFKDTIKDRVEKDPAFREELFKEGIECFLTGDLDTGKAVLRDYINATIGFDDLGKITDRSPKSLMRMFGPKGNPQARNLFEIIAHLQEHEGIHMKVHTVR